jgi:glycosyltransferase involved in cell wall biosynthesis
MRRIMIVTNSLTGGGAERSMNLVSNELFKRGWVVAVVPINSGNHDKVEVLCEIFPLERSWREGLWGTLKAQRKFQRLVTSWNPDLIILNCDLPELFGALLLAKKPLIAVEHVNRPWASRVILGKLIRKILEFRNTTWVAVSAHLRIWPNANTPKSVILNSIELGEKILSEKDTGKISRKLQRIVFIGRLAPQKRPLWLLEIASSLQVPLVIIGDGVLRGALEFESNTRKLSATFMGQVTDPWASIRQGDLLLVPSEYEGDGLVVIEALDKKIPFLVSDIPDFRRFGFPEYCYCSDVEEFVEKITYFGGNLGELSIPSSIANQILNPRLIESVGDSWEEFLRKTSTSF